MPYSQDDYEIDSFIKLLEPLNIEPCEVARPFLDVSKDTLQRVDTLLEGIKGRAFVTMFPGASIPERQWGADKFGNVAQKLAIFGIAVVVVGGAHDKRQGEAIIAGTAGVNLAGRTSLSETAAIIRKSALLLSGDSGLLHIAVGLDVPTVSLSALAGVLNGRRGEIATW